MTAFPSYATLIDGLSEQRESALLRTEMESGPPKQARIKSRVLTTRPVTILLGSKADYLRFVDWFSIDLDEGAAWFDWLDPVSGTTKAARFAGGGLDATAVGGDLDAWSISQKLETWG